MVQLNVLYHVKGVLLSLGNRERFALYCISVSWNEKGVEIINERTHVNGIKRFYKHVTARPRWPITKCALTQT